MTSNETNNIFVLFGNAWTGVLGWFNTLIESTNLLPVVLGVIIAMMAIRFIIYPALKPSVGSSDTVKKRKKK